MLKHITIRVLILILLIPGGLVLAAAGTEIVKFVPRDSFIIISADFEQLTGNEVFERMSREGKIWSFDEDTDLSRYFQELKLNADRDIKSFVFSRYVNSYGTSGKLRIFELRKPFALPQTNSTKYLNSSLVRLTEEDHYATLLAPNVLSIGSLNEVKTSVDVGKQKLPSMDANAVLASLHQKLPNQAAVWGIALPLNRRKASAVKAKQSTNAMLSAFENYYFYGIPTKTSANTHFFGQTKDEKQAAFATAFMTGTLLVAKFRAQEQLAEMLDRIDIQQSGNSVHITAPITKEMVDAYFEGKLGL